MSELIRNLKSTAAANPYNIPADIMALLDEDRDVPRQGWPFARIVQPTSWALQPAKLGYYIPAAAPGDIAIPNLAENKTELFKGTNGVDFQVCMMEPRWFRVFADGTEEELRSKPSRDEIEKRDDPKTGFKAWFFRGSNDRFTTRFYMHGLFDERLPATFVFKGEAFMIGRELADQLDGMTMVGRLTAPMLARYRVTTIEGRTPHGSTWKPKIELLGLFRQPDGPTEAALRLASQLRRSLKDGGVTEVEGPPAPPEEAAPETGPKLGARERPRGKTTVTSGWPKQTPGTVDQVGEGPRPFAPLGDDDFDGDFK